jgi:hypothetical protein
MKAPGLWTRASICSVPGNFAVQLMTTDEQWLPMD